MSLKSPVRKKILRVVSIASLPGENWVEAAYKCGFRVLRVHHVDVPEGINPCPMIHYKNSLWHALDSGTAEPAVQRFADRVFVRLSDKVGPKWKRASTPEEEARMEGS